MVTLNVSDIPPIVSVTFVVVELLPDEVCRTVTVLPLFTASLALALVYAPPLMEYSPPIIEMSAAVLMPETVMVFDVITVLNAKPV